MTVAELLRSARAEANLSLRDLAARSGTSHATLSAYEHATKTPSITTLRRVLNAAGFGLDLGLSPRLPGVDRQSRADELVQALELAAQFPTRLDDDLTYPRFGPP